ncbi:uncharacterized protein LOC118184981 [Stegodyphus dumicola]|uniref:uncharacterized protein LOC118184981 n=1 Tax=Stegodyphus dumicola TaxID=202533 RepID=UPI0015B2D282|nr:uncharacterized protein LOC118184981 [Stegodyphus dumicola]
MEKQSENVFTWIITSFSMCHQPNKQFLRSPEFTSNYLPDMNWQILLLPRGNSDENYIAVYLRRTDGIPELCNINYTMQGLDVNGKSVFYSNVCTREFEGESTWGCPMMCKRDSLFMSLKNDILIIELTLSPSDQELLPTLSYKNGLFADVVLRANGAEFKVHKAVLLARWPKLVEKLDTEGTCEQVFDMGSNVLEAILKYVYTGKLDCNESDSLAELYTACEKCELPILQICLPVVTQKARTSINVQKISFEWPIKNFSSLPLNTVLHCHSFNVDILKSCKWNLSLHIYEDEMYGCRAFDIFLCKMNDPESNPIFVRSNIFNGFSSFENEHLFGIEKNWKCGNFSRVAVDPDGVLRLKFEFRFSDCSSVSEIRESSYAYVPSINCHSINNDFRNLYNSGMLSDINIIVGSETFPAHKFVLCARSPVFSRMFQTDMIELDKNDVKISDIEPQIMDKLLLFMYTGSFETSLGEAAEQLYVVADKYDVPALKKRCSSFLKSNLNAKNVCRILELANMHSDDDLYKSVFRYSFEHAEEIFSTDEWEAIAKGNLYVKFLQEMFLEERLTKTYYQMAELVDRYPVINKPIRIAIWNANGLLRRLDELREFLRNHDIDIAIITETHASKNRQFSIPNYCSYGCERVNSRGGGVMLYVKQDYESHLIKQSREYGCELVTASVVLPIYGKINFSAFYNPPKNTLSDEILNSILPSETPTIVAGDFNAKHKSWKCRKSNKNGRVLHTYIIERNRIKIHAPNEYIYRSRRNEFSDILDISLSNTEIPITLNVKNELSSDHLPIDADEDGRSLCELPPTQPSSMEFCDSSQTNALPLDTPNVQSCTESNPSDDNTQDDRSNLITEFYGLKTQFEAIQQQKMFLKRTGAPLDTSGYQQLDLAGKTLFNKINDIANRLNVQIFQLPATLQEFQQLLENEKIAKMAAEKEALLRKEKLKDNLKPVSRTHSVKKQADRPVSTPSAQDTITASSRKRKTASVDSEGFITPASRKQGKTPEIITIDDSNPTEFQCAQSYLWARWPEMAKKLEAKNSEIHLDVEPNMLETIIKYIYTGEMDFNKHESLDIYAAAVKCEISSLSSLPIVAMTARTHINVKKISFEWPIGKLSRLPVHTELQSHVFAAHGTSEWSLIFNIRMDAKTGKLFKISLCRKNCLFSMKPVFVRTKISLDKFSKTYLAEGEHMFKSFENWVCAEFPGGMDSEELEDVLLLKCEFKFADWKYSTHVEEIEHAFVSPIINHFRADLRNLYKGGKVSDIDIAVGSRIFPAHKFILCARSSVFFRIFEAKRKKWKSSIFTISDVDPEVMDEMLLFMYSGNLEKPLEETAMKLYAAADKYDVVALKQKCLFFLKSNTTVQNVCSVLQLSHMYNDDEWHKAALEFFAAHVAEVLSTDEWKKIPKDNFWFKILENVIVKNIPTEKAVPDVDRKVKQS